MCVCVCVCVCARARTHTCVCERERDVCACMPAYMFMHMYRISGVTMGRGSADWVSGTEPLITKESAVPEASNGLCPQEQPD